MTSGKKYRKSLKRIRDYQLQRFESNDPLERLDAEEGVMRKLEELGFGTLGVKLTPEIVEQNYEEVLKDDLATEHLFELLISDSRENNHSVPLLAMLEIIKKSWNLDISVSNAVLASILEYEVAAAHANFYQHILEEHAGLAVPSREAVQEASAEVLGFLLSQEEDDDDPEQ